MANFYKWKGSRYYNYHNRDGLNTARSTDTAAISDFFNSRGINADVRLDGFTHSVRVDRASIESLSADDLAEFEKILVGDNGSVQPSFWSMLGNGLSNGLKKLTGSDLTDAEKQANAFSADQASIDRQWQQDFYERYQSIGAQVKQYEDNGLNKALMFGGSLPSAASSAPSSSAPSVSPGGSPDGGLSSMLSFILGISQLAQNKELVKSQINKNNADAAKTGKETEWIDDKNIAELQKIFADIAKTEGETSLIGKQIEVAGHQITLIDAQVDKEHASEAYYLAQAALSNAQTDSTKKQTDWIDRLNQASLDLSVARTRTEEERAAALIAQAALNNVQELYVSAQADTQNALNKSDYASTFVANIKSSTSLNDKQVEELGKRIEKYSSEIDKLVAEKNYTEVLKRVAEIDEEMKPLLNASKIVSEIRAAGTETVSTSNTFGSGAFSGGSSASRNVFNSRTWDDYNRIVRGVKK